jgi:AcrR family transcriptional regulator
MGTTSGASRSTTLGPMREVPAEMATKLAAATSSLLADFDSLQMGDIAAAAGVARSSLYYYFTNKDDVLAYLLRSVLDELTTTTAAAASGPGNPAFRLGAVIQAQLEHLNNHPAASQLLIANLGRAGKLPEIAAHVNQGFEEPVRRLLAEGAADGSLRTLPDDDLGAAALFGAVLVIGLRSLVREGRIDVERVTRMIGPMFWHGLAPTPETPIPGGS